MEWNWGRVRENIILHRKPKRCEIFCCSLGVTKLSLKSTIVSIFRSEIIIKKLKLTFKYHQLFLEPGIWFDLFFKYIHMYIHVSIDWLIYCLIVYYVSITCTYIIVCFLPNWLLIAYSISGIALDPILFWDICWVHSGYCDMIKCLTGSLTEPHVTYIMYEQKTHSTTTCNTNIIDNQTINQSIDRYMNIHMNIFEK
jgi:hypothetical protein